MAAGVEEIELQQFVKLQIQEIAMQTLPWDSGPALYPCRVVGGVMEVCPSSLHVFHELGEGLQPFPSCGGYCGSMVY